NYRTFGAGVEHGGHGTSKRLGSAGRGGGGAAARGRGTSVVTSTADPGDAADCRAADIVLPAAVADPGGARDGAVDIRGDGGGASAAIQHRQLYQANGDFRPHGVLQHAAAADYPQLRVQPAKDGSGSQHDSGAAVCVRRNSDQCSSHRGTGSGVFTHRNRKHWVYAAGL
ncbi:hypothetical protein IWW51_006717, partial [Coemansia sp. RSA 2702]